MMLEVMETITLLLIISNILKNSQVNLRVFTIIFIGSIINVGVKKIPTFFCKNNALI